MPSVLWHCWLGGRKGIRPVKNWAVGYWHGYLSGARCRLAYMAQWIPLPLTVSCFSKIQIGFTFLVPAHLGSPGERVDKRWCVYAVIFDIFSCNISAYFQLLFSAVYALKIEFSVFTFRPCLHNDLQWFIVYKPGSTKTVLRFLIRK